MTLKVHHLRPAPGSKTAKTRVGRGEGSKGKTAGRGTKGTKARYQVPERFEGGQMPLHMRSPKLKGFKNPFGITFQVVNVATINALFPKGGQVTVADLVKAGGKRDSAVAADATVGGLDADGARDCRRLANRSARVGSDGKRCFERGQTGRAATA